MNLKDKSLLKLKIEYVYLLLAMRHVVKATEFLELLYNPLTTIVKHYLLLDISHTPFKRDQVKVQSWGIFLPLPQHDQSYFEQSWKFLDIYYPHSMKA